MDPICDIISHSINIDSYLNLGENDHLNGNDPILQENQQDYDQFCTSKLESQILLPTSLSKRKAKSNTLASEVSSVSQKKTGKEATAKYREKRKKYVQELQIHVKKLEDQINTVDQQIKTVKDSILVKLQSQTKAVHNAENAQIFNQIQNCIPRTREQQNLADLDKINLLLNTLKYRIGPSGRQRQAKIQYNFKNIVNTLFPGLHRYFLVSATQNVDLFRENQTSPMGWTQQLMKKINLSKQQQDKIKIQETKLKDMHHSTLNKIKTLHNIKKKMREQALKVDCAEDQMRETMNPLQCAKFGLFCEKYKYRQDIALDEKFKDKNNSSIEYQMQQLLQFKLGRKRVHRDCDEYNQQQCNS